MLLIDAGNTFIKWARPYPDQAIRPESVVWKNYGTVRHHELAALKTAWQALHQAIPLQKAVISNVAGQNLGNTLFSTLKKLEPAVSKIEWFYSVPSLAGIKNTYLDHRQLGSDRFASLVGARMLFPDKPLIVVTAGTATTIDSLSPDGTFQGGMILPGLKLMAESLAQNTAQLPEVSQLMQDTSYFANHTGGAILSGCINAQAGAIERAFQAHRQRYSEVRCLLSGGAAKYLAPHLSLPCTIIDNLVLIGLYKSSSVQSDH